VKVTVLPGLELFLPPNPLDPAALSWRVRRGRGCPEEHCSHPLPQGLMSRKRGFSTYIPFIL